MLEQKILEELDELNIFVNSMIANENDKKEFDEDKNYALTSLRELKKLIEKLE